MASGLPQPVLVTGASGFIGGRLVRRLLELGVPATCLLRPSGAIDTLAAAGARIAMGDVTDPRSVEQALISSRARTVFHLAGLTAATRRADFERVNLGGSDCVASACAGLSEPPVLVLVSSLAAAGPSPGDRHHQEADPPMPVSSYGKSKLAGELAAARHCGSVPITIIRAPMVYGPGDRAVLEIFRPIARWGFHPVPGWSGADHDRRFSLVQVDDLVSGLLLAAANGERLQTRGATGQGVYYLSEPDPPSYAQLGLAIAAALGRAPPRVVPIPGPLLRLAGIAGGLPALARGKVGRFNRDKVIEALAGSWTCSAAKADRQLDWRPAASREQRLRETAEWYRQHGWL